MSKLRRIREKQYLTQEELSAKSGVSVRTIQRIESGISPKGHTLKALSKAFNITEDKLLDEVANEDTVVVIPAVINEDSLSHEDLQKLKLINLSSVLFIILPPLNVIVPILLFRFYKQNNDMSKQIISLQIIWTILAPIVFILGILTKPGHSLTIALMVIIVLSNVLLIMLNLREIDQNGRLRFMLKFNII